MEYRFKEWLECPACDGDEDIGMLVHSTDIVLECYGCGQISDFTIGQDVPLNSLDADEIESVSSRRPSN